jgi:hypothetical protein
MVRQFDSSKLRPRTLAFDPSGTYLMVSQKEIDGEIVCILYDEIGWWWWFGNLLSSLAHVLAHKTIEQSHRTAKQRNPQLNATINTNSTTHHTQHTHNLNTHPRWVSPQALSSFWTPQVLRTWPTSRTAETPSRRRVSRPEETSSPTRTPPTTCTCIGS